MVFLAAPLAAVITDPVIHSQHDLTAGGTGPVKSTAVTVCVFCHAPHNYTQGITPLWDHTMSSQSYTVYASSTYKAAPGTPAAGSSKLCLSCHDGTVAMGLTVNSTIVTTGSLTVADNLTANLANGHPVGMVPVDGSTFASLVRPLFAAPPATNDPAVKLVAGRIECVTCHDPHVPNNDPALPMFLVRTNSGSTICLACHDPSHALPNALNGWAAGSHAIAANIVPTTAAFGPYGNVAADGCSNCHNAHNNPSAPRSLKGAEETACSPCHAGTNASPVLLNIMGEYAKAYSHPTLTVSGIHDPFTEATLPTNNTRHAECADCHNSHAAYAQTTIPVPPAFPNDLAGVSGWDTTGAQHPATKEYQLCYNCHADSTNKPATSIYGKTAVRYPAGPMPATCGNAPCPIQPPKPADQYNLRLKFASTIGHNVAGNSIATTLNKSLLPYMLNVNGTNNTSRPLTATSLLYCTDCHNNDQARSSNGTGPNGPHGSLYPHLLQLNLFQDGGTGSSTNRGALCGKCHNLTTVGGLSPHGDHNGVGCTTCHDPHGIIGGTFGANFAMMNFDTTVAAKTSAGYFGYYNVGTAAAISENCYTICHGQSHPNN